MREEHNNILVATLGESEAVVQEVVIKLAKENIPLKKVLILFTRGVQKQKDSLGSYLKNVLGYSNNGSLVFSVTANTPKICAGEQASCTLPECYEFVDVGVDDVNSDTEKNVENCIYYYVLREVASKNTVYVSIAGGRKTESAVAYSAGLFFGTEDIVHVLPSCGFKDTNIQIFADITKGLGELENELAKYELIRMQRINSVSLLFRIAFRKRFLIDLDDVEPIDDCRRFKIKGEERTYSSLELLAETSSSASEIMSYGLRSFVGLSEALEEFGKIMTGAEEFPYYKEFVDFIQDGIVFPKDNLAVNWRLRWLWGLNVYPEFVNHDIEHAGEVLRNACLLVREFCIPLSAKEKLILALSSMFHDIGMTGFGDKFYWTEVRSIHGILSTLKMKDQEGKIFKVDDVLSSGTWKAVRTVCAFHDGEKFCSSGGCFCINDENERKMLSNADCYIDDHGCCLNSEENDRLNLITSVLRLADACDMGQKMLMGRTVMDLQTNWNKVGKDKAILLAQALLRGTKYCDEKKAEIEKKLISLKDKNVTGFEGREGMRIACELVAAVSASGDLPESQLKETIDRIYYFFKQSPDHYEFHEHVKAVIPRKNGNRNVITVNMENTATSDDKSKAKQRLEEEIRILEQVIGIPFRVEVEICGDKAEA